MGLAERRVLNRAEAIARKAARQRRRDLERELADYDTPEQCCDLEATLDRYPDSVTHELREILSHQYLAKLTQRERGFPAIGGVPTRSFF